MDDLNELDWVPVPNGSYIMKYAFCDTGYNVLLSNLTSVYGEKMRNTDVETRFNSLNSHVRMKPHVILEKLKRSLKMCLTGQSDLSLKLDENQVTITLNFHAARVLCKYDIEVNLMPADKVMHYIIAPTVLGAFLSQRKVLELQKKIISMESTKSSASAKTVSPQKAIEPDWLKGINVPAEIICDSFLEIQSHFKDLYSENYEAYSSSRKIKAENASSAHPVSPPKKAKFLENINKRSINFLDEDDESSRVKKEEELNNEESLEPPRIAARKKTDLKF